MPLPAPSHITRLEGRTILKLSGADRVRFLQGLVTADIEALQPAQAAWAACLTPQGRWQADFFAIPDPDDTCLLLDCSTEQAEALRTQLMRFRLRSDVQMELTALPVYAAWGNRPEATLLENAISVADPRLPAAGWRLIDPPATTEQTATQLDYDLHRLALGLPDGVQDCEQGRTLAAEANMDLLGGIAWKKGCYMGQEVTARMHYRTLLKRRLVPIAATAPLPAPGTAILHNGQEVGTLRSSRDHIGLALLKVDMTDKPLTCLDHNVVARPPAWLLPALGTPPEPSATTPDKP
ncbi:MAG: folate-binding protein [Acetobacter fabarum]|uniref:CAF17-like 4Fe-4S cluster assembly/insertion protein YgfZ n=1 Tax=Acetobacter fabarum TaxID=483199 RepID=UPI0039ECD858